MNEDKPDYVKSLLADDDSMNEINKITESVIGSAYKVANSLGCGFLEKVYENALAFEISKHGLEVRQQESIKVYYETWKSVFTKRTCGLPTKF